MMREKILYERNTRNGLKNINKKLIQLNMDYPKNLEIVKIEPGISTGDEIITMSDGARYYKEPCFEAEIMDTERFYRRVKSNDILIKLKEKGLFVKRKHRY